MSERLTHIAEDGSAHMVDVGGKAETRRVAVASGTISMSDSAMAALLAGDVKKGDVLGTARIAGIMAAKRTADLIPLCHPLAMDAVDLVFEQQQNAIKATATVSITAKTGIEMEPLTAVSVALLTIYDMVKAIDKSMIIHDIMLISKTGGKSGDWVRPD